jgi:hypothetical protein
VNNIQIESSSVIPNSPRREPVSPMPYEKEMTSSASKDEAKSNVHDNDFFAIENDVGDEPTMF